MRLSRDLTYSVPWNLFLLTLGAQVFALGYKGAVLPNGLLSGGISGLGLLLTYVTDVMSVGAWYLALSAPLFLVGWLTVSRRFLLYTIYGVVVMAVAMETNDVVLELEDKLLAAIAGGVLMGAGLGLALRSLGSTGGLDIVSVTLHQRYNLRMGQVSFTFNLALFGCGLTVLPLSDVLYSLAMLFITASTMEYFLGMFNTRKVVLVVSDKSELIGRAVNARLHRGVTLLHGRGMFSGTEKEVMLTVINNVQLKALEKIIYGIDPGAFTIVANTLQVLGEGFAKRKTY